MQHLQKSDTDQTTSMHDDAYWSTHSQKMVFRHSVALEWCDRGPVLDVGCGDGFMLEHLKNKGIQAYGVDHSAVAIEQCHTKGFDVYDSFEHLPKIQFSCALLLDVLEHTYDPGSLLRSVPCDTIIITVPNFCSLPARIQVLLGRVPENNSPKKGHVYWFTWKVLKALVHKNGFEIVRTKCNTQRGLHVFGRLWPSLFGLSFSVLIKKV